MRSDLIAEINTDSLAHNLRALRARCAPGVRLCAPLKADAYGHGVGVVAKALQAAGAVDYAAAATLDEAVELRGLGWGPPILLLGNVLAVADDRERRERIDAIVDHDLTVTIVDLDTPRLIAAAEPRRRIRVHVKLDSGMGRMGEMPERIVELVRSVRRAACLELTGFYSHFATADFADRDLVGRQLATFNRVLESVRKDLPPGVIRHLANSAATISLSASHFDMVRPGLALYGYLPADHLSSLIDLRPILRLCSHLTAVKDLPAGHCVGYGQMFTTKRPTRLGIIPVGYFDGYLRSLSSQAIVGTASGDAPVIGRISMDQMAIDLTNLPRLRPGAEVTLIDDRADRPNSVAAVARRLGTIPYEVTCLLGSRIDRVAIGSFCA
ncbi:MAG: alanine racemase [Phycisphaerae bacterium]